ncbi:hypothetical protein [Plantactinospora sp. DSM 117369]
MDLESGAGLLHRLTSYEPGRGGDVPVDDPRGRHDLVPNDPGSRPTPMKAYHGLPAVPLPRELPAPGVSATSVLAGQRRPAPPARSTVAPITRACASETRHCYRK